MKKYLFDLFICLIIAIVIKIIIQTMIYPNFLTIHKSASWGYDWSAFFKNIVLFQIKYALIVSYLITQFRHLKM